MDVARLLLGILVAVALPAGLPALRRRPVLACLFSVAFALYAVVPVLNEWAAFSTVAVAVGAAQWLVYRRREPGSHPAVAPLGDLRRAGALALVPALIIVPLVIGWLAYFGERSLGALMSSAGSDQVAVVVSGLLLATFVGNDLAYLAVRPYVTRLSAAGDDAGSILPSGIYVGWVERAVIFGFVTGGQADAAALAVAAKALIRLPEVQEEHKGSTLGEYIIVGTLASVLVSVAAAVATRLALGLPAL